MHAQSNAANDRADNLRQRDPVAAVGVRQVGVQLPTAGRGIVPYITTWSGEQDLPAEVIQLGQSGIGFADETVIDRDDHDVLWTRQLSRPGDGRPEFRQVHPLRQRRAMRRLLCQVCAQPADRNEQGVLWLLRDHRDDWPDWPEDMANTYPPVCLGCAHQSIRLCPTLRKGYVAVRALRFPYRGVYGQQYAPGHRWPIPVEDGVVTYNNPAIRWTCAVQLVRSLQDCTIVDLDDVQPPQGQR
jgi:hypothetical protein